jgi:hypothetical protein
LESLAISPFFRQRFPIVEQREFNASDFGSYTEIEEGRLKRVASRAAQKKPDRKILYQVTNSRKSFFSGRKISRR